MTRFRRGARGETQLAIRAESSAGWFEGRIEIDGVGRRGRCNAIKSRNVVDAHDVELRGYGRDVGETVTTMSSGRARGDLACLTRAGLRDRDRHRGLVSIEAATAME